MPKINFLDLDLDEFDVPAFEPIRRNQDPVNGKHDLQRRSENGINRFRKERERKNQDRD